MGDYGSKRQGYLGTEKSLRTKYNIQTKLEGIYYCRVRILEKHVGEKKLKMEEKESYESEYCSVSPNCGAVTIYTRVHVGCKSSAK